MSPRSAPTSSPARRTSSSGRTAACWPPARRCWRDCAGQAAAVDRRGARALRARHPALRAAGRYRRRRRLPRRARRRDGGHAPGARCWPGWPRWSSTRTGCARVEAGLAELPGVTAALPGRAANADPAADLRRQAGQAAYEFLAERGVNAPASSFYALEASRRLGLGDDGGLRVGLAPYSNDSDVDRLLAGSLHSCAADGKVKAARSFFAARLTVRSAAPDRSIRAPSDMSRRSAVAAPDR